MGFQAEIFLGSKPVCSALENTDFFDRHFYKPKRHIVFCFEIYRYFIPSVVVHFSILFARL